MERRSRGQEYVDIAVRNHCVRQRISARGSSDLRWHRRRSLANYSGRRRNWKAVSKFGALDVPEYGYINDIEASLHDQDTVYVAINNHKRGDFRPYVVKSTDRGETWQSISGDLPERGSVYSLKQDHEQPDLLFCGTEFGCYVTVDGGQKWIKLSGLPTIAIRDIEIQRSQNDLVLASFGRGFYILDDYSPLRSVSEDLLEQDVIMPIRTGLIFRQIGPLGRSGKAFQGARLLHRSQSYVWRGHYLPFARRSQNPESGADGERQEAGQSG